MLSDHSKPAYSVKIVPRSFAMCPDDWHATVVRKSDGKELVFISDYLRVLCWKTRRRALDRTFRRHDRWEAKMAAVREFCI